MILVRKRIKNYLNCLEAVSVVSLIIMVRKKVISALPASDEFFKELFKNSLDAIFIASIDGSIYYANPAACRLLDRTEVEICQIGRNGIVESKWPQLVADSEVNPSNVSGELFLVKKDGTQFPVDISVSFYFDNKGHERLLVEARDITKRKKPRKSCLKAKKDTVIL